MAARGHKNRYYLVSVSYTHLDVYKRQGIYQVMPITDAISRIIMQHGTAHDIADQAKLEGVNDLRRSGILKVMQGLTSVEEVEACTNE